MLGENVYDVYYELKLPRDSNETTFFNSAVTFKGVLMKNILGFLLYLSLGQAAIALAEDSAPKGNASDPTASINCQILFIVL